MSDSNKNYDIILNNLKSRSRHKQDIYKITCEVFDGFKNSVEQIAGRLQEDVKKISDLVTVEYRELNDFECMLKISGDILIFSMHTNVFMVNPKSYIYKTDYVKEDPVRAYCGVVHIHNFLADSIKYNRTKDLGYLVARVFVNKDKHFFVEGQGQLGFAYEAFPKNVFTEQTYEDIVGLAINYSIEFDLLAPDYEQVQAVTLKDKQLQYGNSGYQTDKVLGYKFSSELE